MNVPETQNQFSKVFSRFYPSPHPLFSHPYCSPVSFPLSHALRSIYGWWRLHRPLLLLRRRRRLHSHPRGRRATQPDATHITYIPPKKAHPTTHACSNQMPGSTLSSLKRAVRELAPHKWTDDKVATAARAANHQSRWRPRTHSRVFYQELHPFVPGPASPPVRDVYEDRSKVSCAQSRAFSREAMALDLNQ
jgi:hypothetical protein